MLLVQDDDVVETFSAQGADQSLRDGVRLRRTNGRRDSVDADALSALSKLGAIDGIPIAEQMAGFPAPWCGLDELPPHPSCRRVGCHVDMHQLASAVGDEYQHVQRLERQRGHRQQIGGPKVVSMVAQERAPGLTGWARWFAPAIASNRATADHDAQLQQLASDPFGAPQPVVAGHSRYQVPYLRGEMRASATGGGPPTPEQAPALPMPTDDGVRGDERQVLAPAVTAPTSRGP